MCLTGMCNLRSGVSGSDLSEWLWCRTCRVGRAGWLSFIDPRHLGNPIPSPAIMEKIGTAFRHERWIVSLPTTRSRVVRFSKGDRKIEVDAGRTWPGQGAPPAAPEWPRSEPPQEFPERVHPRTKTHGRQTGSRGFFVHQGRPAGDVFFYFYLWGRRFRTGRSSRSAPTSRTRSRCGSTAHEWAKRQATQAGIEVHRTVQRISPPARIPHAAGHMRPAGARAPSGCSSNAG